MVAALETPESWCAARVHAHVQARRVPCGRERLPDRRRDRWLFRWPALHAALCGHTRRWIGAPGTASSLADIAWWWLF